jgi:hypothetical protein
VLLPGPEQVVLLPKLPCPLVSVVWLFVLLPTWVVHVGVPFVFVKVPPLDVHCCSDGEAASTVVGPNATSVVQRRNNAATNLDMLVSNIVSWNYGWWVRLPSAMR